MMFNDLPLKKGDFPQQTGSKLPVRCGSKIFQPLLWQELMIYRKRNEWQEAQCFEISQTTNPKP